MTLPTDIEKSVQHRAVIRASLLSRLQMANRRVDDLEQELSHTAECSAELHSFNRGLRVALAVCVALILALCAIILFGLPRMTNAAPLSEPVPTVVCCPGGLFMPRQYLPLIEVRHP